MKTFFTSYYAKSGDHPLAVAVSLNSPDFYKGRSFPALFPTWDLIMQHKNGKSTDEQYTEQYKQLLSDRDVTPESIYNELPDGAVLLCYEKSGDFCHRRILAEMIEESYNIEMLEIIDDDPVDYLSNFIII